MSERTLTRRELNRALLARQLLLDRARLSIPRAVEQMGTVQAQYAPAAYVALWTRLPAFDRDALTRALERRTVVQGTMMRNTIHVASPRDSWPLVLAIRPERMAWSRRIQKTEPRELERAARRLRAFLSGRPPRSRAEIVEKLGPEVWRPGIGIWLDLVRVPPSGTWERRRADLYGLAEEWVGSEPELDREQAVRHLVRRYLGAFGPARRIEVADWAGMRVGTLKRALDRMRLRRFRDEQGRELLDLPRAPLPEPETPAPPRFLPVWDATLLVHARRTGILPEEHRPRIFNTRTPHSFNTFLVDGAVAGAWRYENGGIALEPFGRIPREARKELAEEAERLAAFHA